MRAWHVEVGRGRGETLPALDGRYLPVADPVLAVTIHPRKHVRPRLWMHPTLGRVLDLPFVQVRGFQRNKGK